MSDSRLSSQGAVHSFRRCCGGGGHVTQPGLEGGVGVGVKSQTIFHSTESGALFSIYFKYFHCWHWRFKSQLIASTTTTQIRRNKEHCMMWIQVVISDPPCVRWGDELEGLSVNTTRMWMKQSRAPFGWVSPSPQAQVWVLSPGSRCEYCSGPQGVHIQTTPPFFFSAVMLKAVVGFLLSVSCSTWLNEGGQKKKSVGKVLNVSPLRLSFFWVQYALSDTELQLQHFIHQSIRHQLLC